MRSLLPLAVIALAACASTPDKPDAPAAVAAPLDALAPQQLADGECGLFAWDVSGESQRFVFFATTDRALAWLDGEAVSIGGSDEVPSTDGRYGPVTLRLGRADPLDRGTRYPNSVMKYVSAGGDAWSVPVVAVESCIGVDAL